MGLGTRGGGAGGGGGGGAGGRGRQEEGCQSPAEVDLCLTVFLIFGVQCTLENPPLKGREHSRHFVSEKGWSAYVSK